MSRSKKWRLEWAFFLGENGRRQYKQLSIRLFRVADIVNGCFQR